MTTHASIFAWKTPWTKELMGYNPWGSKESDMTECTHTSNGLRYQRSNLIHGHRGNVLVRCILKRISITNALGLILTRLQADKYSFPQINLRELPPLAGASQVALVVKNSPANAGDTRDLGSILGQEDPLEKEMATSFSILAWRIPWTEEPGGLQPMVPQRV